MVDNPYDWQELDSYYSLFHQYFSLAPGNPLMELNFFEEQAALASWYSAGVIGSGDAENPDSWNGVLLEDMSDVAIQNFQTALDTGSFWFNFEVPPTDDEFLFSTNQTGPHWNSEFNADGWSNSYTQSALTRLLAWRTSSEDPILDLSNWVSSHGGMIDYNGDGRVDMGDFLELSHWANFGPLRVLRCTVWLTLV